MNGVVKLGYIIFGLVGVLTVPVAIIIAKFGFMTGVNCITFGLSAVFIYSQQSGMFAYVAGILGLGYLFSLPIGYLIN